ncbi:MAG: WbqC family protein [Bacteroidales bacterium]|nr:WbqC family protein [Bacteroidales bacterium]MBN2632587.1 WbqC family protein [Bacteroidales bacterium]
MSGRVLLSTAYLPPAGYFNVITSADEVLIEREENYIKQTYRNRCYITGSSGPQLLTVPVCLGSFHKTPVKDLRIDYSRRWQQVHRGAIMSAYRSSPYYLYYHQDIEDIIMAGHKYLLDLNMYLLESVLKMIKLEVKVSYTEIFEPPDVQPFDFRYKISPKKPVNYQAEPYTKVFNVGDEMAGRLSIIDLIFNTGPLSLNYLKGHPEKQDN